jgi:hypothetical protein
MGGKGGQLASPSLQHWIASCAHAWTNHAGSPLAPHELQMALSAGAPITAVAEPVEGYELLPGHGFFNRCEPALGFQPRHSDFSQLGKHNLARKLSAASGRL